MITKEQIKKAAAEMLKKQDIYLLDVGNDYENGKIVGYSDGITELCDKLLETIKNDKSNIFLNLKK